MIAVLRLLVIVVALLFAGPASADECCRYRATIMDVYDGDTVTAVIDLGLNISVIERVRISRIDAPEVRGPEREAGLVTRDILRTLIEGKSVIVITDNDQREKYGRLLAEIEIDGLNVSDHLVAEGLAEWW